MTWTQDASPSLSSLTEPGKYALGERIAAGDVIEVLRAELRGSDGFRRPVVVHRLQPRHARDPACARRFVDEARFAARLTHAHLVQVIDCARSLDGPFAVLEQVDGPDGAELLRTLRARGRRLPVPLAVHIVASVLKALDYLHRAEASSGRAHGEVRPSNIRLSVDGQVKLAVFDGEHALGDDWRLGGAELGYTAPELLAGEAPDVRTDLYAVAVVLHELLTGEPLFPPERGPVAEQIRRGRIPAPSARAKGLPRALDRVVLQALESQRDRRFADAESFLQALLAASVPTFGSASARELAAMLDQLSGAGSREARPARSAPPPGALEPAWAGGVGPDLPVDDRLASRRLILMSLLVTALALAAVAMILQ